MITAESIRTEYAQGLVSQKQLALKHGVSDTLIGQIVTNHRWKSSSVSVLPEFSLRGMRHFLDLRERAMVVNLVAILNSVGAQAKIHRMKKRGVFRIFIGVEN
jgi:hypothetical protein